MKIRLIEPISPSRHLWSKSYFVRLGLPMIGAALVEAGHDVRIFNPQLAPIDWADVYSSDLVGISSTTSTIIEAYRIGDDLRRRGIPVIIGGSHVTFMADEALRARGLRGTRRSRRDDHGGARGGAGRRPRARLHHRHLVPGRGRRGRARARCTSAARTSTRCRSRTSRSWTATSGSRNTPIMTSWGCPFDCTFCSVTAMFGKKYRFRSAESVVAEIKEKKPEKIFFYDDNMAANRKRLKRLLQLMIDEGVAVPWGAQVRTDVVRDQELMELMRASNCDFVALGLESVNQATLDSFEKSQTVGDIEHAIKVLHDYGIRAHGMFVLGADHDTPDSVSDTVKFAKKNKIDTVMLNILTPLPGTQQFEELDAEGRILERDWSFYDAQHVVFRPKQMTPLPPPPGDDQGQQALLRHLASGLGVPQVAVAARRRPEEEDVGPHARVRLALVLLAHVVDRRQEPRAAPPAAAAEQAAAPPGRPRLRAREGLRAREAAGLTRPAAAGRS